VSLKLGLYTRNCQLGLRSRSRGISARAYSALQVPPNPRALGSRSWLSGRFGLDSAVQAIGAFTPKGVKNRCVLQTYCTLKAIQDMSDPCSCANVGEARVTHSDLELRLDFSEKIIHGYVQHTVLVEEDNAHVIAVDTRDITLHKVQLLSSGSPEDMKYELSTVKEALGSTLSITLPSGLKKGDEIVVGIRYTTSKSCTAVQFLDPKQTAEGTHPYLFSQCQAIHARSLVPCQDLPSAKISYTATVWVPEELTALMSAVPVEAGEDERDAKRQRLEKTGGVKEKAFRFVQKVPIPTYLLAIAAGKLESRDIGPRSRIWSEASMVEAGAYEFAETEKFLAAGESIAGEYVWGRYDILLLPPSFPYGGMENPCLTFVTPTLLAGDRSQANVVAHEIAHSWCGNLVTNRTWEHFWMNEGFTVFLERNILAKMHGEPMLHFHALGGLKSLTDAVKEFGPDHPYTALVPDLSEGSDPDDAFSRVCVPVDYMTRGLQASDLLTCHAWAFGVRGMGMLAWLCWDLGLWVLGTDSGFVQRGRPGRRVQRGALREGVQLFVFSADHSWGSRQIRSFLQVFHPETRLQDSEL